MNSTQIRCIKQRSDKFLAPCQILVTCPDCTSITACNSECAKLDFLGSCDPRVCVFQHGTNNFHERLISKFLVVTIFVFTVRHNFHDRLIRNFLVVTVFVFFGKTQAISMTGQFNHMDAVFVFFGTIQIMSMTSVHSRC